MSENNIQAIMETTMDKLRAMVDANTVIGQGILCGDVTIYPVSKISFGVASGGSDFPNKHQQKIFGGGGGAGVTVTPVAFLAIKNGDVRLLQIYNDASTIDRAIQLAPDLIDKVKGLFKKEEQ